ncbi:polyamine aminopropyltransferase [Nocardioides sp. NPDC127514]|uniref:polyamine aminopropyltransferase n=1 Tax=unclassified Nocardioides TaxID=2615069 RepID=UPI0013577109
MSLTLPSLSALPEGRAARLLVLAAVFVCAACGLVYELALVTLGSYLLGNSIAQTSLVIAVSMFAMGIGAVLAKPLTARPLRSFVGVEIALAAVGGASVPALYAAFAWLHLYTPMMLLVTFLIGALVGAEIPLLMELLQRLRRQQASLAVADINAVDYVGALIGGLAFPFVLLPTLGLLVGTVATAALNVLAAWTVGVALAGSRRQRGTVTAICGALAVALGLTAVTADSFELNARQALYRDPIIHSQRSAYQEIVVTRGAPVGPAFDDVRLFLDGDLQFSSLDEYRYHEMLVHPAMNGPHQRVLILGGGDGLAAREVLRYQSVSSVTLVDLDPAVVSLARSFEPVSSLTSGSLEDPRLTYVADDAFSWVRDYSGAPFDVVIADFPDPDSTALAKLYSVENYSMIARLLAPSGRMVVQSGSPFFAPDAFWSVRHTLTEAGYRTTPYQADVPSFGNWGYVLASRDGSAPELALDDEAPGGLRYASDAVLAAASSFPPDRAERPTSVTTLLDPAILDYARNGWVGY